MTYTCFLGLENLVCIVKPVFKHYHTCQHTYVFHLLTTTIKKSSFVKKYRTTSLI